MSAWIWFRRIVVAVVAVAVLLFAAVTVALYLVDTEALKSRIEARVEAATGRELRIEGPLEATVLPSLGFELNRASLANAPGFGDQPFIAVEHAELGVRVLPLLRGEVSLETIVLRGLRVNAARNAQGETNWADLTAAAGAGQAGPKEPAQAPAADGKRIRLLVGGVNVRDARLSWRDGVTGRSVVLSDLGLTMNTLRPNRPTPLILGGRLSIDDAPPFRVQVSGRLSWDLARPSVSLGNLAVGVIGRGHYLPPGATVELSSDLHVDGAAKTASVERIVLRTLGRATARGALQLRYGGAAPSYEGHLTVDPFNPAALAEAGGWTLPERADPESLSRASVRLNFAGTPDAVTVKPLEAQLDETRVSGHARARLGEIPSVEFALAADDIDLNRYLPPRGKGGDDKTGGEDAGAAAGDPIQSLPLEALNGVAGEGRVTVGRLQWRGLTMQDLRLQARLAEGILELTDAGMRVAGGEVGLTGRLNASDTGRPAARLQANLTDIRSQPLLAAFLDRAPISGRLTAQAALAAQGGTLDDWIRALDGDLTARFADGAIQGINIAQRLRTLAARLRGDEVAEAAETRRTDFSSLQLSARVRDGVAHSNDLDLRTPLLRVGGEGWVDLADRSLDYTARILVTGTLEGQGGAAPTELRGAEIPLRLSGDLGSPSIELKLAEVLRERAGQQLQQEAEELEQKSEEAEQRAREKIEQGVDEAGERIERKLRKGLEGLFE